MKVLLVEDNPGDALLVQRMLSSQEGRLAGNGEFQIFHYERLEPALASLAGRPVDVALLDLSLPDSHGLETVQRTRAAASLVPIVVLTGTLVEQMTGVEALREGAQDYLIKNKIDADRLGRTIRYAMARKKIEGELILARESLRQANAELEKRVRERTAELLEANRSLENLLYVISHDLREPARGIELLTEKLFTVGDVSNQPQAQEIKQRIIRATIRMRRLLDDVLELSRTINAPADAGEVKGEEVVQAALQRLEERILETQARIRIEPELPAFRADRVWATQAVYNLLANALKFTRPGEAPDIEIGACCPAGPDGEALRGLVVRDRGPGVPAECAESIFELFRRAVGREVEGTGAGLAIVSSVAKKYGGRAWMQPRAGGGSEFFIAFGVKPRRRARR